MADRYWVGGTGNWNDTAKWAATSGGAGGETVPTSADNAYFDGASDTGAAFTVTLNVTANCKDFIVGDGVTVTALDQAMTLAGTSAWNIYGSLFFPATSFTNAHLTANISFLATTSGNTITTNGNYLLRGDSSLTFNGSGDWTLGSSLSASSAGGGPGFTILDGTFNTANFNISQYVNFQPLNGTLNLGASEIIMSRAVSAPVLVFGSGLTLNAGTSTFKVSSSAGGGGALNLGGKTFYNFEIDRVDFVHVISGANTFNNLSVINSRQVFFNDNQIVNGTLTIRGSNTDITSRTLISGAVVGGSKALTCAAVTIGDGVDFRQIEIDGAAAPLDVSTKSTGDAGGNIGITGFAAPKTVYWNLAGSQNWNATAWATTPTGTPAIANFPLVQDTAVITEAGNAGTITIILSPSIGTLTLDDGVNTRTSAVTLNLQNNTFPTFFGDLKLSSGAIISGTATAVFAGRNTQNITGAGKTFTNGITLDSPGGTLVLQDNLTLSTGQTFTLTSGTLNLNGKVPSFGLFLSSNSNVRSIAFGSSKIQISGNGGIVVNFNTATNFTYTGTPNFELTYSGSTGSRTVSAITGVGESNAFNVNVVAGTDTFRWTDGNNYFNNINLTGFSGLYNGATQLFLYGNLTLSSTCTASTTQNHFFISNSKTQLITASGKTLDFTITKQDAGTLRLEDNLAMGSTRRFTHTQGTVNLNGKNLSCNDYSTFSNGIRNLTFGSGQILLQGTGTVWDATTSTNMTITPGTGKIVLANNTNTARTFAGGGITTYPELEIAGDTGTATTTITGSNRFRRLTNSKLVAYTIVFPNAITAVDDWNLNGSEGNLITLSRTGGSGTFTINYSGTQFGLGRYLSISNSAATPANRMYAIFSTDGGSNTGWVFNAPKFGQFLTFFAPPI
jgi:hypothetical protein